MHPHDEKHELENVGHPSVNVFCACQHGLNPLLSTSVQQWRVDRLKDAGYRPISEGLPHAHPNDVCEHVIGTGAAFLGDRKARATTCSFASSSKLAECPLWRKADIGPIGDDPRISAADDANGLHPPQMVRNDRTGGTESAALGIANMLQTLRLR